jgi:hypothetical protein
MTDVETYVIHGTVPWYDVTALIETETGNWAEVLMYTVQGTVACVTETVPLIGNVTDVEIYVCHGVVACVTLIGTFVTLTGKVALVET